jgi:hypothetical protein
MSFLSCSKVHALVSAVTSAKDDIWYNHGNLTTANNPNPLMSKAENGTTHNFEPQPF